MSTAALHHRNARPGPGALALLGLFALLFAGLGAMVVEPALHGALSPGTSAPARVKPSAAPTAPPPPNDIILDGDYAAADGARLRADGATLAFGRAALVTAPHRLVIAADLAAQGVSYATALNVPANVQIEVRRVESGGAPLCAGSDTGWLAMAVRADGVTLLPLRAGGPPGAALSPTALCPVRTLERR